MVSWAWAQEVKNGFGNLIDFDGGGLEMTEKSMIILNYCGASPRKSVIFLKEIDDFLTAEPPLGK